MIADAAQRLSNEEAENVELHEVLTEAYRRVCDGEAIPHPQEIQQFHRYKFFYISNTSRMLTPPFATFSPRTRSLSIGATPWSTSAQAEWTPEGRTSLPWKPRKREPLPLRHYATRR